MAVPFDRELLPDDRRRVRAPQRGWMLKQRVFALPCRKGLVLTLITTAG